MKTVEIKLTKFLDASKITIPNIMILKGKNKTYFNESNYHQENPQLRSLSLKYFGTLNEKLVIASKKFRTTCNMIDMPLMKSQKRKKIKLTLSNYTQTSNSENPKLSFPLLIKSENVKNSVKNDNDYLEQKLEKLEKHRRKERKKDIESECDISLKNIKVIDPFKSFKENQIPISFRLNKKPTKSNCEIINGNRYSLKYDTIMEKSVFEKKKNKIDVKKGFGGKKIGEFKNIFLPKYIERIKTLNSDEPLIKEEKIQFNYVNGVSLNSAINLIN